MSSETREARIDNLAHSLADIALGILPDRAEAAALLVQASTIIGLKDFTLLELAATNLEWAENMYASARAKSKGGK